MNLERERERERERKKCGKKRVVLINNRAYGTLNNAGRGDWDRRHCPNKKGRMFGRQILVTHNHTI
jgi:hypothetical protein